MVKTVPLDKLFEYLLVGSPSDNYFKKRFGPQVPVTIENMSSIADYILWEDLAEDLLNEKGYEEFMKARDDAFFAYIDGANKVGSAHKRATSARWKKIEHRQNVEYAKAFVRVYNSMSKEVRNNELANHA
jgi:hypothetical protein